MTACPRNHGLNFSTIFSWSETGGCVLYLDRASLTTSSKEWTKDSFWGVRSHHKKSSYVCVSASGISACVGRTELFDEVDRGARGALVLRTIHAPVSHQTNETAGVLDAGDTPPD